MKFTKLNTEPRTTTFGKLKDGDFFITSNSVKRDIPRLYRKVFSIVKDGDALDSPVHNVPFGALISPAQEGWVNDGGYQFAADTLVYKVEIEEIVYRIV